MDPILDWLQITFLAFIQGLTEFLPISSSGHLILLPQLLGWPDQGLAFDVAVHLGTLLAVTTYFRRDVRHMAQDWTHSLFTRKVTSNSRLAWAVIWATIPAVALGLVINQGLEAALRNPILIAATTIGFGALLWWADIRGKQTRDEHSLSYRDIAILGFSQALALIPGTSRSGITMTAGLLVGLTREAAARFSFLLSIPIIAGAGTLKLADLLAYQGPIQWNALLGGLVISAITAWVVIALFLKWIQRLGMAPFAWYRFVLGGVLLWIFL
jgi:undecaprenyl-diphosphatase